MVLNRIIESKVKEYAFSLITLPTAFDNNSNKEEFISLQSKIMAMRELKSSMVAILETKNDESQEDY